eukprot:7219284-Ditylum_brightwellii.AAC.1
MQQFNTNNCPIPFEDRHWSHYRKNFLNCKEKQKRHKGLVVICNLMIQIGGKLGEIATVAKLHIKTK